MCTLLNQETLNIDDINSILLRNYPNTFEGKCTNSLTRKHLFSDTHDKA